MNKSKAEQRTNRYREETYKKTGFGWGDTVQFIDRSTNPPVTREGQIEIVDVNGGGIYSGVCTSFDIGTKEMIYKHVPISDVLRVV